VKDEGYRVKDEGYRVKDEVTVDIVFNLLYDICKLIVLKDFTNE